MSKQKVQLIRIVFGAVLAAMVFVVTMFRFPLLGSKVHFANAVCLLSGLLLGPVWGGTAAGLGSALYDLSFYNEGIINLLITFVSMRSGRIGRSSARHRLYFSSISSGSFSVTR